MRIIKEPTVRRFWGIHPQAETPLRQWLAVAKAATWRSIQDVRLAFPSADAVQVASGNTVTVFDIAGNRYRLITAIKYRWQMVYIRDFLTHAEYSSQRWKGRH
jgi:mRNA interferase HigB